MFYSLREGFVGLKRAKFSSMVTVSIISISLIMIGIFLILIINSKRLVDSIQARIELEVFIDNSYDSERTDELQRQIAALDGINSIRYISKEEAAEIFKQQFDKDIFVILDENPLPSSFQITLKNEFQTTQKAEQLVSMLEALDGVDDVVFRQDILVLIEKYLKIAFIIIVAIGTSLLFGSIFFISNTIKLTILSRLSVINIMKLVGAKKKFIRRPFLVEGIIQGCLGSGIAIGILLGVLKIVNIEIVGLIVVNREIFFILFILGVFLGFSGSIFAIQRFLKY